MKPSGFRGKRSAMAAEVHEPDRVWGLAMDELRRQAVVDSPKAGGDKSPEELEALGKAGNFDRAARLYIRYSLVYRSLEDAFAMSVHPQKRADMKMALEVTAARLLQLKRALIHFSPSKGIPLTVDLSQLLVNMQLCPQDIEITPPRGLAEANETIEDEMRQLYLATAKAAGDLNVVAMQEDDEEAQHLPPMPLEQAIDIVKRMELGRQAELSVKAKMGVRDEDRPPAMGRDEAAIHIQRAYRGHAAKQSSKVERREESVFLHMETPVEEHQPIVADPTLPELPRDPRKIEQSILREKRAAQAEHREELKMVRPGLTNEVEQTEGAQIKEQQWNKRYEWWVKKKEDTGEYPPNFEEYYKEDPEEVALQEREQAALSGDEAEKKGKKKKAKKKKAKKASDPLKDLYKAGLEPEVSMFDLVMPDRMGYDIGQKLSRHSDTWQDRDEADNFEQKFDKKLLIDEEIRPSIAKKIKKEVDERLLETLETLKDQVDTMLSGAKSKKKKGGKKGGKKSKKKKTKKAKPPKRSPAEKAVDAMGEEEKMGELFRTGVLRAEEVDLRRFGLTDYAGASEAIPSLQHTAQGPSDAPMAQVRQLATELGIIPLCSPYVRKRTTHVPSLLLYGARGTGKRVIARGIAAGASARVFNVRARQMLADDPTAKEIARRFQLLYVCAKELQPSVILVDEIHQIFTSDGKKKKSKKTGAARMAKDLLLLREKLKPKDRILILGTSSAPYEESVDLAELKSFFADAPGTPQQLCRMIYTPLPDYTTRRRLWARYIRQAGVCVEDAASEGLDLSNLAYVSEGYASGSIQKTVEEVLGKRRQLKMDAFGEHLRNEEFLVAMARQPSVDEKTLEEFQAFTSDVTGRDAYLAKEQALLAEAEKEKPKK